MNAAAEYSASSASSSFYILPLLTYHIIVFNCQAENLLSMLSGAPATREAPKVPSKRLLFSKPSWSKSQNLGSSDLFHRSDQIYVASTAETERKRRERLGKKEKERVQEEDTADRATKRQCILKGEDEDDDEDDDDDESDAAESPYIIEAQHTLVEKSANSQMWNSPTKLAAPTTTSPLISSYQREFAEYLGQGEKGCLKRSDVINLDDEESPAEASELSKAMVEDVNGATILEDEATASDEEFPELARKAREKARKMRLEQGLAFLTPDLHSSAKCKDSYILPPAAPFPSPDPVLQILITSSIPNTTPLIVSRRLSQRLKDVRLAWADRQHFSGDFVENVFLTWRGKRLFDVTTCKSLGVAVDLEGRVLAKDDVLGDDEGRIHMEAMTLEILEARRKAKTKEAARAEDHAAAFEIQRPAEEKPEDQVRIILMAKGFENFKLKVKPVCAPQLAR